MWISVAALLFWSVWLVAWLLRRRRPAPLLIENLGETGKRHWVHGQPVAGNEMLRAPLSGRECVYFETRAVLIFAGERVLARKTSAADFYVDDGTGQVLIPRDQIRGLDAPEDVVEYRSPEEVFGLLGATAPDRNLNNMIVYERIIPSLTPISVQGVAVRSDAANRGLQLENCEIIARCEAVSVELQ